MSHPTAPAPAHHRWLALTVLLIPAALTLVSVTSVNVGLPAIRDGLGADPTSRTLVLTTYSLAYALALLPSGWLGDRFGHSRIFVLGVAIFTLGNLWCGLAPDITQLVAARIFAGTGAGLLITPVTALIQLLYSGPERARPFGVMGAVYGAASAVGPIMGGLLIELGGADGWRGVFLVNVPVGVIAVILALIVLPKGSGLASTGNDAVGMLLFSLAVAGSVLPFSLGNGFALGNLAVLLAGIGCWIAFVAWIRRRAARGSAAVIAPSMFARSALPIGVAIAFLGFASFTASFLMLALLWQDALGHSVLEAGLLVAPFAIGSLTGASFTGRLSARFGTRLVTAGLTCIAGGMAVVAILIGSVPAAALTIPIMLAPLFVTGFGVGLFVGPNANGAFVHTAREHAGVASALVATAQRCGSAVGVGVLSALYVVLPGGAEAMSTQVTAALVTSGFAAAGIAVMLISRRSAQPLPSAPGGR